MTETCLFIEQDWEKCVKSIRGRSWISIKPIGMPSLYGYIECSSIKMNGIPVLKGTNGFEIDCVTSHAIQLRHVLCGLVTILSPYRTFKKIHQKSITSLDVINGQCVSASDSIIKTWSTLDEEEKQVKMIGHYGDIYCCRWFPSVEVVLSCGADLRIKVWNALTGECAITLTGHTNTVTDIAIVDRGKNIISVSKDGTVKLWHVASGIVLDDLINLDTSINCCSLSIIQNKDFGKRTLPINDKEFGTNNKALLIGCENGIVALIAVYTRKIIISSKLDVAVNACFLNNDAHLFVGCNDGSVLWLNTELVTIFSIHDTTSSVRCLCLFKDRLVTGHSDGSCVVRSTNGKKAYLSGTNSDSIYDISTDGRFLYTACRDGIIRKYLPELLPN